MPIHIHTTLIHNEMHSFMHAKCALPIIYQCVCVPCRWSGLNICLHMISLKLAFLIYCFHLVIDFSTHLRASLPDEFADAFIIVVI